MSRPAGHEAGDKGGEIHAWDELARLAGVLDALMDMNMGSGMTVGEFDGYVAAVTVCPEFNRVDHEVVDMWTGP